MAKSKKATFKNKRIVKHIVSLLRKDINRHKKSMIDAYDKYTLCKLFQSKPMKALGFRPFEHNGASNKPVYISRKLGLVVKIPYIADTDLGRRPTPGMIPTVILNTPELKRDGDAAVYVQPLAKRSPRFVKRALKVLDDKFFDAHWGNVGYYQGKPVIFDW